LLTQLDAQPGIESVGVVSQPPLLGAGGNNQLLAEGALSPSTQPPIVDFRPASAGYFETMRIALRSGRLFDETDSQRSVAVVSALTARRAWPSVNPIGKRFRLGGSDGRPIEVVGVVGDVRGVSLTDEPTPTVYLPYWQRSFNRNRLFVVVKTSTGAAGAASIVRRVVGAIDSNLAMSEVRGMEAVVNGSTASRRFQAVLLLLFGVAALVLTTLGTYAMLSYTVVARTTEIGVRLALGEPRRRVLGRVLGDVGGRWRARVRSSGRARRGRGDAWIAVRRRPSRRVDVRRDVRGAVRHRSCGRIRSCMAGIAGRPDDHAAVSVSRSRPVSASHHEAKPAARH
jgi:hypothetical protein